MKPKTLLSRSRVCLYHGVAKSLSERVEWHAAQKLSLGVGQRDVAAASKSVEAMR
jgi:predicted GIY-YIG superfamily endonuclease